MSELLDSFMEHHPISPVGTTIKPDQLKTVQEEVRSLREQLAKANERVRELEDKHLNLVLWHNLDPQQAKLYSDKYANKFAIEKKIEALKELLTRKSHKSVHHLIEIVIDSYENQLRKEQE